MKKLRTIEGKEIIIDDERYETLSKYSWFMAKGYPSTSIVVVKGKSKTVGIHRLIMGEPRGLVVDHINGNVLDNRVENLRICTIKENARHRVNLGKNNTSGVTGVCWNTRRKKWVATITVDRTHIHLGAFVNKDEAIKARHMASDYYFGEFSPKV